MSDLAHVRSESFDRLSAVALAFALGSAVVWVLAGTVDDGLYLVNGLLGIVGFSVGVKARREARRAGERGGVALAAMILGGLLGAAFIVFTAVWGVWHLV